MKRVFSHREAFFEMSSATPQISQLYLGPSLSTGMNIRLRGCMRALEASADSPLVAANLERESGLTVSIVHIHPDQKDEGRSDLDQFSSGAIVHIIGCCVYQYSTF